LQRDALRAAGCGRIFTDEGVSGSVTARRGLDAALAALSPGDTLVVWKLDRLGRSLSHLVTLIAELGAREVNVRSLSDPIDTSSSSGRLVMHIMGALAEFERGLIVERTQAGIQAAKKRGVRLGRWPSLAAAQIDHARALIERGESPRAVARTMRVGKSTLYRAFKPSCTGRCIVRHLDRFAEMGDPLLEGRAAQSLVARLERLRLHIDLPWRWSCIPNPSRRLNPLAQLS
jgi:DNA invertase Pin-like site-specific DNA recombinase